jgi:hypothetical protein
MRQLHQERAPTTQQKDVLAVDPPRDRALVEQPRSQAAALAISELIVSNIGL